jgi:Domain of unknown function (DUF6089)
MNKLLLITLLFFNLASSSYTQDVYFNMHLGTANYQGDLQAKQFTMDQSGGFFGVSIGYEITNKIGIRGGLGFGHISATDAKSKKAANLARNLNFSNNIMELHTALEYHFLDIYERRFTPYVFGGIALYKHNPYTTSTTGRKVFLKPLSTEGQGLLAYPDRKAYKLTQLSLPLGGGIKFNVSGIVRIGLEVGFRKTFTDYLDDVSDKYPDELKLLSERGQESVDFSYRGDELAGGNPLFPVETLQRGSPKNKDNYYFTNITIGIRLLGEGETYGGGTSKRYIMGCPKSVY